MVVVKLSGPELLFELLLREQGLTAIRKQREWLILPDRQVWRERPFRRKLPSPIPLSELLVDLADWGKFPYAMMPNLYRLPSRLQKISDLIQ